MDADAFELGRVFWVRVQGHEKEVEMQAIQKTGWCAGGGVLLAPIALARDVTALLNKAQPGGEEKP
jgi:dienelactone hydrolase